MQKALATGLARSVRHWQLSVLLYAWHVLLALGLGIPLISLWRASLAASLYSARLADELDLSWAADFFWANVPPAGLGPVAVGALMAASGAVYLLLAPAVTASLLGALAGDERHFRVQPLLEGLRQHSGPFYRLAFLSLPAFGLSALTLAAVAWTLRALAGPSLTPRNELWITWVRGAAMVTTLVVIRLAWDYARIAIAVDNDRRAWRQLSRATRLVLGRPGPVLGTFLAVEAVWLAPGIPLVWWLQRPSPSSLVLPFLLQQVMILSRQWARVACSAAQVELYRQFNAPPSEKAGSGDALPAASA